MMLEKLLNFVGRYLVAVLAGIFVLRVGYLFICGLDLIGDESYYWDWSRRPDWCYYSKPPMVAWLIAVFTGLGGDYTAVVRLPAVVFGTVFLRFSYAAASAFYTPKAGALTVVLMLAMPFNVLVNFLMTIDSPLYCFWMMSLYYLHRALFDKDKTAWFWAGVTTGAAILSKQVALLMPLMLICFLLLDKQRHPLFKREFLLYLFPVMLGLMPIVLWNQQHDWVMFSHSKAHFYIRETVTLTTRLAQAGAFVLYQLLLASPVIFVLILIMTYKAGIAFNRLSPEEQFLMLMGPVLLIGILLLSLVQKVQGNWPMPFYFSALILLSGRWLAGVWKQPLKTGVALGFLMVLLTYALPVAIPRFNLQNTAIDPTYRFKHWQVVAEAIALARHQALPDTEKTFVIALGHRTLTSELAFYLPGQPTVYHYEGSGQIASQYEVWGWPEDAIGKSAFIVSEQAEAKVPDDLKSAFQRFRQLGTVANPTDAHSISYYLFLGKNLRALPNNQKQQR
ncbi:MAG: glycosyltransferase family 39 protein [Methylovulum sp.]|nr:glycosyltransferase family 39 protein [Methylovulum sp.]